MPSSHLILCCPLLLLPPIPPSIRDKLRSSKRPEPVQLGWISWIMPGMLWFWTFALWYNATIPNTLRRRKPSLTQSRGLEEEEPRESQEMSQRPGTVCIKPSPPLLLYSSLRTNFLYCSSQFVLSFCFFHLKYPKSFNAYNAQNFYIYIDIYVYVIYIIVFMFLVVLSPHCCVGFFSSCGEWGYSLVAMCRLLVAVASLVTQHRL